MLATDAMGWREHCIQSTRTDLTGIDYHGTVDLGAATVWRGDFAEQPAIVKTGGAAWLCVSVSLIARRPVSNFWVATCV